MLLAREDCCSDTPCVGSGACFNWAGIARFVSSALDVSAWPVLQLHVSGVCCNICQGSGTLVAFHEWPRVPVSLRCILG